MTSSQEFSWGTRSHSLPPPRPCHLVDRGLNPIPSCTSEIPGTFQLVLHGDVYIPVTSVLTTLWLIPHIHLNLPSLVSLVTQVFILMGFLWQHKNLKQYASFSIYRITVPLKVSVYRIWVLTVTNDNANIYLAHSTYCGSLETFSNTHWCVPSPLNALISVTAALLRPREVKWFAS